MKFSSIILLPFFLFVLLLPDCLSAQRNRAREEKVLVSCDLPQDQKNIVAVSRFDVKVRTRGSMGNGMADMLTNALLNSGCFRVVDRQTIDDILKEQDFGASGRVDPATAANIGKLTGAQLIVKGIVTEFKEVKSGGGIGVRVLGAPVGVARWKAHIGFMIQIINVETGELIISKSVDADRTSTGLIAAGGAGGVFGVGGFYQSKAMGDALEEAIISATAILADERGSLPPPVAVERVAGKISVFEVVGMSYSQLSNLAKVAEGLDGVTNVSKKLDQGNGILEIRHTNDIIDVLDSLLAGSGMNLEPDTVEDDYVRFKM